MNCPKCKHKLVAGAKFCHQCGTEVPPELIGKTSRWYYDPVFVLLMIFLVLAVFGLPLLWKSPRFSNWQKVVISFATIIYTGVIIWLLYYLTFVLILPYYNQLRSVI